ncbi:hypothetical protein COFR110785_02845 [Corynebacterium frankenforstense]
MCPGCHGSAGPPGDGVCRGAGAAADRVAGVKDPTRIPRVLDAVRRAWEGRPDLELATLFAMLGNEGIGWGADDEELIAALEAMAARHPESADTDTPGLVMVRTESPAARLTLDMAARRVTVRSGVKGRQPVSWLFEDVVRLRVGMPCVLRDSGGVDHRLGVVAGITVEAGRRARTSLRGLTRGSLDRDVYALRCTEGKTERMVLAGRGLDVYAKVGREVEHEHLKWARLVSAEVGEQLRVAPRGGGAEHVYGEVIEIFAVELGAED